jgi:hypothetical protein
VASDRSYLEEVLVVVLWNLPCAGRLLTRNVAHPWFYYPLHLVIIIPIIKSPVCYEERIPRMPPISYNISIWYW